MSFVAARVGHKIGHLAASFLPGEVWILELCAAEVSAKYREKHGDEGFIHIF